MKTLHTITKAKEARTMLKVLKFGGSSMADAHQLEKVRSIVEADPARRVPDITDQRSQRTGVTKDGSNGGGSSSLGSALLS